MTNEERQADYEIKFFYDSEPHYMDGQVYFKACAYSNDECVATAYGRTLEEAMHELTYHLCELGENK